jgi:hypothetical protein
MRSLLLGFAIYSSFVQAAPWEFDPAIPVTPESRAGIFVHLESSGRKNIAASKEWVAIVWEDNRDGTSRCYVSLKSADKKIFGEVLQISGKNEAAEPVIVSMGNGRFALAWEEAEQVWVRILTTKKNSKEVQMSSPQVLSGKAGAQISLNDARGAGLYAVWSEQGEKFWQIRMSKLETDKQGNIRLTSSLIVDKTAEGDQSYPGIAVLPDGNHIIAWEDRRAGHTRIMYTGLNKEKVYTVPQRLNEAPRNFINPGFGRGAGVMRVALAALGQDGVAAVWADKRDFQSGYDVYGDFAKGDKLTFGKNEKVQDEFGDSFAQWHPAIAANDSGSVAVVWDDDREGSPDVWLAWKTESGWSGDHAVPGASGTGVQSDPSITMDEAGNLHLAWVEKNTLDGPSQIRYLFGRVSKK